MCVIIPYKESQDSQESIEVMPRLIPIYYHNNLDCTISIDKFINHEHSFHPNIQDYASTLYHIIDSKIVSACTLTYGVIEYIRDGVAVNIYYPTIQDWIHNYSGETQKITYILDKVFIGENYVPLWDVIDHV